MPTSLLDRGLNIEQGKRKRRKMLKKKGRKGKEKDIRRSKKGKINAK
jgi:hypothetical protein